MMVNEANIRRFTTNLFAYPEGYFEQHTPEELHISDEDLQELIRLQSERKDGNAGYDRVKEFEKEFLGE